MPVCHRHIHDLLAVEGRYPAPGVLQGSVLERGQGNGHGPPVLIGFTVDTHCAEKVDTSDDKISRKFPSFLSAGTSQVSRGAGEFR
jgi:hypothetical protein